MDGIDFKRADISDVGSLLSLVEAYHRFEGIELLPKIRRAAVSALLADASLGGIWLIRHEGQPVGYIALCYGYSIEFAGRDAFIDEFYISAQRHRLADPGLHQGRSATGGHQGAASGSG